MNINFDRAEIILASMVESGMSREQAVPVALALEFAVGHPDYAEKFGQFSANNLEKVLTELSNQKTVAQAS